MRVSHRGVLALTGALLIGLLPDPSSATQQAQERRAGRDVRQETRQGARHTKQDCRAANQQSNGFCRANAVR